MATAIGKPHTEESKAKISAANKGKTPWNAVKQHSEETRRKIAEGARRAALAARFAAMHEALRRQADRKAAAAVLQLVGRLPEPLS